MKLTCLPLLFALAVQTLALTKRRTKSILTNPDAQPDLPSLSSARKAAKAAGLSLDNIQGDILVGMKKKKELFFFFSINDVNTFKTKLASDIHPRITTTTQLLDTSLEPTIAAVNVAFSQTGLAKLGVSDNLDDFNFADGQQAELEQLGDQLSNWEQGYRDKAIHGVFLIASDTIDNVNTELQHIKDTFGEAITERHRLQGQSRPGDQDGHEHFGFMDGISQPAVTGFASEVQPGQNPIDPGIILLGEDGDFGSRPDWAKDGSFLAFRQLKQLVPEFNKFLADNPLNVEGLTREENSALLGARMIGRWKSGAPVDLAPLRDDPLLAKDPKKNNNFNFADPGEDTAGNSQLRCPFSAHIRKTRPRADFGTPENKGASIMRAGIPYGPELTESEAASGVSDPSLERGLAFVSYQSSIGSGFSFIQKFWVNSQFFIFGKNDTTPGVDPIIGVDGNNGPGAPRSISGLDPDDANRDFVLPLEFIVSRGGEYFFSPSLSAILDPIAKI